MSAFLRTLSFLKLLYKSTSTQVQHSWVWCARVLDSAIGRFKTLRFSGSETQKPKTLTPKPKSPKPLKSEAPKP